MKHKLWHKHAPCSLLSMFHVKIILSHGTRVRIQDSFRRSFSSRDWSRLEITPSYMLCVQILPEERKYMQSLTIFSPIIPMQVLHENELDDVYTLSNRFVTTTFFKCVALIYD